MTTEQGSNSATSMTGNTPANSDDHDSMNQDVNTGSEGDTVAYQTYKKVIGRHKALEAKHGDTVAKLAEYEAEAKERNERTLIEDKKFQEALALKDQELEDTKNLLNQTTSEMVNTRKLTGFLQSLGTAKLESKYFGLVDLDRIKLDDEGSLDHASLNEFVTEFKTEHTRLLINPKNDLPANHTGSSGGTGLNYKDWQNLKSAKEKREQWKNIDQNTIP